MSYVTNPIANRLGIQQGWSNSLISWQPGLNSVSFITYLKCYLLMQEYLRYNQINLVFFEINPLQKNKKIIHVFIYKNIFYLGKNELTFDSRKELTKTGFLQLAAYFHGKKINEKFKSKSKNTSNIFYSKSNKKTKLANQFSTLQSQIKLRLSAIATKPRYLANFKTRGLLLHHNKNFLAKLHHMLKIYKFKRWTKKRPNGLKNTKYYKKKRLSWKFSINHFLKSKKFKKLKYKWRPHKYGAKWKKSKITQSFGNKKDLVSRSPSRKRWQLRRLNKKNLRSPKLFAIYSNLTSVNLQELIPDTKKNLLPVSKFLGNSRNKAALKSSIIINKKQLNQVKQLKGLKNKRSQKTKKKRLRRTQYTNYVKFLKIAKWFNRKFLLSDYTLFRKKYGFSKKLRKARYFLWNNFIWKPLALRLSHTLFKFRAGPKNFKKWLWKNFEKNKIGNPFQFILFAQSSIVKKHIRNQKEIRHFWFKRFFNKEKKLQLVWKNRSLYDFKNPPSSFINSNKFFFTKYISFINTHNKLQKFSIINSVRFSSLKMQRNIKIKNVNLKSNFDGLDTHLQKLYVQVNFFIEKYMQKYLKFPVVVKLKNISNFVSTRSNQKVVNYTKQMFLKSLAGQSFFTRLLYALLNVERIFNPQIFVDLIATEMQTTHTYRKLVNKMIFMFSILHSEHIMGYKVLIDGKLGGSKQKSTKQIFKLQNKEKIPVQTFTKNISFALGVARTPAGLFGIRMWFYY